MRRLLVSLFIAVLAFMANPFAVAHVEVVSSFPERYANVNPIPTMVWIEFSGELQNLEGEIVNSIEVTDSTGLVVSYEDAIIEAGRITTKVSGQSAAGVFIVKYRVVGQDGHVIEGDYTFNASPDYAAAQSPMPISAASEESSIPVGGILLGALLLAFFGGIFLRAKNRRN
jgi:methionine-rich copper-binding protein CopC